MTSVNFVNYFASEAGMSKKAAKEMLSTLDSVMKSYISNMNAGESVKIADVIYKVVNVPERSGVTAFNGTTWTKPAHDTVKLSASKALKDLL